MRNSNRLRCGSCLSFSLSLSLLFDSVWRMAKTGFDGGGKMSFIDQRFVFPFRLRLEYENDTTIDTISLQIVLHPFSTYTNPCFTLISNPPPSPKHISGSRTLSKNNCTNISPILATVMHNNEPTLPHHTALAVVFDNPCNVLLPGLPSASPLPPPRWPIRSENAISNIFSADAAEKPGLALLTLITLSIPSDQQHFPRRRRVSRSVVLAPLRCCSCCRHFGGVISILCTSSSSVRQEPRFGRTQATKQHNLCRLRHRARSQTTCTRMCVLRNACALEVMD